ncbi:MAG: NAD(P)H-quinone oxidoreductase subunit N [Cyanothece sp. SIO1E1]|nr:NAD(P)H-quinone oxidoreductase subunit N [Cyanothece sp. SIO1E1]
MALLTTGKKFIRELDKSGALAVRMPLEGGFEGRYQRRLRASGYDTLQITVRGLGDLSAYLMAIHGVRPPHLGKKDIGHDAAVGNVYYIPPIAQYRLEQLPIGSKGLVLWLLEGHILSRQELEFLTTLPMLEPRIKVILELGGDRSFKWFPLRNALAAA